jgi:hypothetical protein
MAALAALALRGDRFAFFWAGAPASSTSGAEAGLAPVGPVWSSCRLDPWYLDHSSLLTRLPLM